MSRQTTGIMLLLCAIAGFLSAQQPGAEAHVASKYFTRSWQNQTMDFGIGVNNSYGPAISNADLLASMKAAGDKWDAVSNASTFGNFENGSAAYTTSVTESTSCSSLPSSAEVWVVSAASTSGRAAAMNCTTTGTTTIYRSLVKFRATHLASSNWYGPASKPPGDPDDGVWHSLMGSLVHEFGHTTGFGYVADREHFVDGSAICDDSPQIASDSTMCPTHPSSHTGWYKTTLSVHGGDHTFAAWY